MTAGRDLRPCSPPPRAPQSSAICSAPGRAERGRPVHGQRPRASQDLGVASRTKGSADLATSEPTPHRSPARQARTPRLGAPSLGVGACPTRGQRRAPAAEAEGGLAHAGERRTALEAAFAAVSGVQALSRPKPVDGASWPADVTGSGSPGAAEIRCAAARNNVDRRCRSCVFQVNWAKSEEGKGISF